MPFTKTWNGAGSGATAGAYGDSRNWELISLRTPAYAWTQVGATAEYYVRTAALSAPGFAASPPASNGVYINGASATQGTLTSLNAGEWAYGDPATLGYNTITVRITGDGDPDAQLADYIQFRQIPQATENVRLPAGSASISSNLDQSAVAIEDFIIEEGYDGTIGSATGYLRIDPNKLEDHGRGQVFIDIAGANITCLINSKASADEGEFGHNLRGTNINLIDYRTGLFGLAARPGEVSTFATFIGSPDSNGIVKFGKGVTSTQVTLHGGTVWAHQNSITTMLNYGGKVYLQEAAAVGTLTQWGGELHYGSSGNITTLNLRGGLLNEKAGNATRTIGTVNKYRGSWIINRNKEAVTHTTVTDQDSYTQSGGA
jgi:hypothetical protein